MCTPARWSGSSRPACSTALLERLPDAKGLQERHAAGRGLTAPELAVLLAFTKLDLQRELVASDVPDDPYLAQDLHDYFPVPLRERFGDLIDVHALHREITATVVANAVVNRAGISFLSRLADETGTSLPVLTRAHVVARDVFEITSTWSAIDALDLLVPAATQDRMFLAARRLVERGARWLVSHSVDLDLQRTVTRFREPVADVVARLGDLVIGADAMAIATEEEQLRADGVPAELASRVAGFQPRDRRARDRRHRGDSWRRCPDGRGRLLRGRRPSPPRLAPRSHRCAASCRPVADEGARRAP